MCQSSYIMRTGLKEKLTVCGYQFHFKSIDYNITWMQHALCLVKTLLIIIQVMVQHKKSLILIYWRPLVLWKQRGCFECWKQWENICSFIIYQICYLQWGLINWLHHFGPLFFAAWWRPRNFRNFLLEFPKLLAEKEKLPYFCCKKIIAAN